MDTWKGSNDQKQRCYCNYIEVPDPYDDNYDWTDIHNKLLENPLDDDYDVDNKILFIFNSSNGNEILHILERNENGDFYNNFIMITDALSPDTLETSYPFVFCMVTYGIFTMEIRFKKGTN